MRLPKLVITDDTGTQRVFELPLGSVVVGRSDAADVPVASDYVSGRHARITWDGSTVQITDLGSTNGTMVNGNRVADTVDLADHDEVRFGAVDGYVVVPDDSERTQTLSQAPATPPRPRGRRLRKGARSVFISYAHEEYGRARVIADHLRARGWHVIIDREVLQPGEIWNQSIAEHIASSSVVLVLISPAAAGSSWVNQELVAAVNAHRPVLPVVIDAYNIDETRRRFAILGDRQWFTLEGAAGRFDPVELDTVAHHLERLAAGSRPDQTVTSRERLGSVIMWVGIIGLVATIGWYAAGFIRVGATFVDIVEVGSGLDLSTEDPFAEVDPLFTEYVGELTGLFVAFPIAFASLVAVITGFVMRRNARKRRLMGG